MNLGYYAVTEVTMESDYRLYYGPTEAPSVLADGGRFRIHILPDNVSSILVVSRDFAGIDIDREAVYSVEQALDIKFIMPIELRMDSSRGSLKAPKDTVVPRKPKPKKKSQDKD